MGAAQASPTRGRTGLDQELTLPEVPGRDLVSSQQGESPRTWEEVRT